MLAPDASTGCADVIETADAGCVEVASSPADPQPPAPEASKEKPKTIREFEHALKALGFSQRESASIARSGFKAASNDTPDTDELAELAALLRANSALLR
jgi:hypothetical protein